jgi:hypothetical protein
MSYVSLAKQLKIWVIAFAIIMFIEAVSSQYYISYFFPTPTSILENTALIVAIQSIIGIIIATIVTFFLTK